MVKTWYITLMGLLLATFAFGQEEFVLPEEKDPVIDFTETLNDFEKDRINKKIRAFSENKGSQIGVVIVSTTGFESIEQFSLKIAEEWQLGREGVDDGVLVVVAKNDRKMRIEVGYGLEGAIPDVYAKRIIDNVMTPYFKDGDFNGGIDEGVESIIALINKEDLPGVTSEPKEYGSIVSAVLGFLAFFGFIFFVIRAWWKSATYYSYEDSFWGKFKYLFTGYKWDWMAFGVQTIGAIILLGISRESFTGGLSFGIALSSTIFGIYFIFRGFVSGPGSSGGGYSSGSSYSSSSSSYSSSSSSSSYSGGGGSFGGGGASGGW